MQNWHAISEPQQLPEGCQIDSNKFKGTGISKSTVRGFKKAYLNELRSKRLREEEDLTVQELPFKKKGRPFAPRETTR